MLSYQYIHQSIFLAQSLVGTYISALIEISSSRQQTGNFALGPFKLRCVGEQPNLIFERFEKHQ